MADHKPTKKPVEDKLPTAKPLEAGEGGKGSEKLPPPPEPPIPPALETLPPAKAAEPTAPTPAPDPEPAKAKGPALYRVWSHGTMQRNGKTYQPGETIALPEAEASKIPCLVKVDG